MPTWRVPTWMCLGRGVDIKTDAGDPAAAGANAALSSDGLVDHRTEESDNRGTDELRAAGGAGNDQNANGAVDWEISGRGRPIAMA